MFRLYRPQVTLVDGSYQGLEETVLKSEERHTRTEVLHSSTRDSVEHHLGVISQISLLDAHLPCQQRNRVVLFPVEAGHLKELHVDLGDLEARVAPACGAFKKEGRI